MLTAREKSRFKNRSLPRFREDAVQQETTRDEILRRIADGTLPRCERPRIYAGKSDGDSCEACGRAIDCGDWEFEIELLNDARLPTCKVTMHRECFGIWQDESGMWFGPSQRIDRR